MDKLNPDEHAEIIGRAVRDACYPGAKDDDLLMSSILRGAKQFIASWNAAQEILAGKDGEV